MQNSTQKKTFKKAFITTIPVLCGYLVLGAACGILLESKGFNYLWAAFIGITMYSGSLSFVCAGLLAERAGLLYTALMAFFVNSRHIVYGISMLEKYSGLGKLKPYVAFATTDETYALLCSDIPDGVDENKFYFFVSLLNHIYWVLGCVFGTLIGSALTINTKGVDFSMTALFVVIFVEKWKNKRNRIPCVIGISGALICLLIFGSERFLIPAMGLMTAALLVFDRISAKNQDKPETAGDLSNADNADAAGSTDDGDGKTGMKDKAGEGMEEEGNDDE